jgi:hypothetical protein
MLLTFSNKMTSLNKKPLTLNCCDCRNDFVHSVGAQKHYESSGFEAPIRCAPCRAIKKAAHAKPTMIKCLRCETNFTFTVVSQKYFKEKGWEPPLRCFDCRKLNKAEYEASVIAAAAAAAAAAAENAEVPMPNAVEPPLPPA